MKAPSFWKYIHKGLLVILSTFVVATITSLIFLSYSLLKLNSLTSENQKNISTSLILQDAYINLAEAEAAARGYVITGDAVYLASYNDAVLEVPKSLSAVESRNDPGFSTAQSQTLRKLTAETLGVIKQTVDARSATGEDSARVILATGRGAKLMSQIRAVVMASSSASLENISLQNQQSSDNLRSALVVAGALAIFVFGLCVVLVWYFQFTIVRERRIEITKMSFCHWLLIS